jgi:hypothetical protein
MSHDSSEVSIDDYKTDFYNKESNITYKENIIRYEEYINLIDYKREKNLEFTVPELNIIIIVLIKSLQHLNNFKDDITDNLIENVEMVNNEYKDVKIIKDNQQIAISNYKNQNDNCKQELKKLYEYIDYIFKKLDNNELKKYEVKNYESLYTEVCCIYKEFCDDCRAGSTRNDDHSKYTFCHECHVCDTLRLCKKKSKENKAKLLWKEKNESKIVKESSKKSKNITINNNILINNSIINNYIITNDRYFEITISGNKNIDQLKSIFISNMCGVNGKTIFPNEKSHSLSKTFNVIGATYCLKYIDDIPILHGMIRYTGCNSETTITENKLQRIIKSDNPNKKANIQVRRLKLWENDKYKHDIQDITDVYNKIKEHEYYGSDIKLFLT